MPVVFILIVAALIYLAFNYGQILLIGLAVLIGLKILSEIAGHAKRQKDGGRERKGTRQGQLEHIRSRLAVTEPLRTSLIDVVEEANALKKMVTRAESHAFGFQDFGATLAPSDFQAKSDQAIEIALDLSDRFGIITKSSKGRARSQRTLVAIEDQQQKMDRLKEALEYSRTTIEVLILTKGDGDRSAEKLSRSLSNLSDALEESYDDGFSQLDESSKSRKVPELSSQA